VCKTLAVSKEVVAYRSAADWEDSYYNLIRPHKSLRLPAKDAPPRKWLLRTPAMAAELTECEYPTSVYRSSGIQTVISPSARLPQA
jgi:hypothetical protein